MAQIGSQRLLLMGGIAAAMLAVLATIALRSTDERMAYLYSDLDPSAAQGIAEKLKAQNVAFTLSPDGTAILAPESKLAELRMGMAGDKMGGKIGYDVLDQEEPFGVSASRAKMNETRAIEGELSRSIETLDGVTRARVHLVMPERQMFATAATKATAAVTVKTKGRLSAETVQSIRYLVASSVPELSPEAVSIVDGTGALLARAGDASANGSSGADERQVEVEGRLRDQVEALLSPIVGPGKVRAEINAEIDRDQTQEQTEAYDPDKQVIAHQVTVGNKDNKLETDPAATGATVGNQLPETTGQPAAAPGTAGTQQDTHEDTSEDTTYANSLTRSTVTRGPGKIKRLTVAVMVDGGAKGLPAAQIQRLTRLVENAVGADSERGDSVVIDSMAFATDDSLKDADDGLLSKLPMDQIWSVVKLLLVAGAGLMAVRMIRPKPEPVVTVDGGVLAAGQPVLDAAGQPVLDAEGQPMLSDGKTDIASLIAAVDPASLEEEINLAQVDGTIKVGALKRVGDLVGASPNEAAAVIRQWMNA